MSSASPADLAITFHSVPRRLREAQGDVPHEVTAAPTSELHGLLAEAARLMGTPAEPDAIGDAIANAHADDWDDAVLARLREIALDLGRLLRHIGALAEGD
jgi:hypothetical protein